MLKGDKDQVSAGNKVVLALETAISELVTTTVNLVGFLRYVETRAFEIERDLK